MMFSLGNYSIKLRLYALMVLSTVGVAAVLALALSILSVYRVNGPVYDEILTAKQLENDVAPPVLYVSELYVTLQEMESASGDEVDELKRRFESQVKPTEKAHAAGLRNLPDGEIKRKLEEETHPPAEEFFSVANKTYVPLVMETAKVSAAEMLKLKPDDPKRVNYHKNREE